ncbi:MAG: glycosyltransferase family 39 protein [Dehalococcoidia bacterium]|nr:glycosyltransferase family 39 protein [Dehalococcoidia bacterium]
MALASESVKKVLENTSDPHPPLFYLMLHIWLSLGRSEAFLRIPSALFGALSVPLVFALGRAWVPERTAVLGALFLSMAPMHVWYSQEVRMYSLLTFLGLVSTVSLTRLIKGAKPVWWVVYASSALAGLYTHYGMVGLLVVQGLWLVFWRMNRDIELRFLISWLVSLGVLFLGFWPWLPVLLANIADLANVPIVMQVTFLQGADAAWLLLFLLFPLILLFWDIRLWFARATSAQALPRSNSSLEISSLALFPILTLASAIPLGTSMKRQAIVVLPYFFLLAASGVSRLRLRRSLAEVALLILSVLSLAASYGQREVEDWIKLTTSDFTSELEQLPANYRRLWVILSHDSYVDPELEVRHWLEKKWKLEQESFPKGITVRLYLIPTKDERPP